MHVIRYFRRYLFAFSKRKSREYAMIYYHSLKGKCYHLKCVMGLKKRYRRDDKMNQLLMENCMQCEMFKINECDCTPTNKM